MPGERFRINAPRVVHETIDGETVMIDLVTGTYFSLDGSGPAAWSALDAGASTVEIIDGLAASTGASRAVVESDVRALIDQLAEYELIVEDPDRDGPAPVPVADGSTYATPRLEPYTDMQDLILLDPVHEVSAEGWPNPKRA